MKIMIMGTSGSGKSTLAKKLGTRYGLPVLHLDKVHFLPGWAERAPAQEQAIVEEFLARHAAGGWVIDGNYTRTCYSQRLQQADRIIVLWFGPLTCLGRVTRRWWQNRGRARDSSAPGCPEKLDAEFIRWVLHDGRTPRKWAQVEAVGRRFPEKYVLIRSQRELERYLRGLG